MFKRRDGCGDGLLDPNFAIVVFVVLVVVLCCWQNDRLRVETEADRDVLL